MSDLAEHETPALPERPVRLREAREAAGLHIAALAAALKVPVRKLEALEAGRYHDLPDLTFARALASSACRQLKVDPAPVLEQIPQSPAPELGESPSALNAPFKAGPEAPAANPFNWLSRPSLLVALVLLLAALVVILLPERAASPDADPVSAAPAPATAASPQGAPLFQPGTLAATETTAPPSEAVAAASPPVADGASPAAPAAPAAASAPGSAPGSAAPVPTAPAPAAPAPTVTDTGSAPAEGAVLRLVASETSWAEITNGTGTVVLQRLLQAGERVEFSAAPPYSVVLGNAGGVQVSVRGRAFNAAAIARNNVARFEAR